ncbi:putative inorganic phosphate cotransporter [Nasonia vitripennis]|uniref:Inorganic phosphate cotransporter n=1 Tax=Nasonia vitripennis TaxID=7425 RepID=A0A7M7QES0_NASVI|nr:putative inorganic phosphate cotransporter [Nasonia vitripennis]
MIVHSGSNWGFYTLITEMPTYMRSILNFNVQKSGTISALPYLAMWILGFPISWLSDYALKRGAPAECIRKVSNTIGLWVPALMMVVLCVVKTENKAALVMILVLAVGFNAGITSGFQINHIDLSPSFAGTLISITNCTGTFFGILAPLVCGAIIEDPTNPNQWQTVFYISALVYFLTNLIFVLFGKAERQPWSEPSDPNRRFRRFSTVYEPTSVAMVVPQLK